MIGSLATIGIIIIIVWAIYLATRPKVYHTGQKAPHTGGFWVLRTGGARIYLSEGEHFPPYHDKRAEYRA